MQSPLQPPVTATTSFSLGDIYYILFRHKWRILICTVIGLGAAMAVKKLLPVPFGSEAKLFVRYVLTESRVPTPGEEDDRRSPDSRGDSIMASEREILSSLDLAKRVAEAVGPERILGNNGGGKDLNAAAGVVRAGLTVDAGKRTSVIGISFRNGDPEIVQPVLTEIVETYLKMHVEIHRAVGIIGDFLLQETDQLRTRLAQTEDELRKARNKAGVISLDASKSALSSQMTRLQDEIFAAEAELAERSSVLNELTKQPASSAAPATDVAASDAPIPPAKASEYRNVASRLELLRRREQELLAQFTPENSRVKNLQAQITDSEAVKMQLESEHPLLVRTQPRSVMGASGSTFDVAGEAARINAIGAKIKVLNAQMDVIRAQAVTVDQVEGSIQELNRKKELEEANYRYYAASLEQSRINQALGNGKVSNISQIQTPSPPFRDGLQAKKIVLGVAASGLVLGLIWSALIEFFLDRSIRRPGEVERLLGVPLFLTIPVLGRRGKLRQLKAATKDPVELLENGKNPALPIPTQADAESTRTENSMVLHSFHETLRDRLISYFESVNLTHKPKLVAVTGLGHGSGVTTTAAGLASSLSETGEGNVLLVDMTAGQGSAQQFYRGKQVVGLEEILSTRDQAQVQDKLFVVAEEPGQAKLSRILPQRFSKLVPKLKTSNFDYIIFDMPPVSQISITPRLAGFMDMVLMVIESEKTDRDLVQRATALLAQSTPHVGAVLNKSRNYVPTALHQEALGNS